MFIASGRVQFRFQGLASGKSEYSVQKFLQPTGLESLEFVDHTCSAQGSTHSTQEAFIPTPSHEPLKSCDEEKRTMHKSQQRSGV